MIVTRYPLSELGSKIETFEALTRSGKFDEACQYFRHELDTPTLFGLEPSLHRARLLSMLVPASPGDLPLASPDDQFVLYSLALTLNLTGGFPGRAIPLYERHNDLARSRGDLKALAMGLGHHAKALRQAGRFFESEQVAREGLRVIREVGDVLKEAVNLYWLGMGLAHRGEAQLSEAALSRSLRIFESRADVQASGVVNVFMAQRALWLGHNDEAHELARRGAMTGRKLLEDPNHKDQHGAMKILSAARRMEGEAMTLLGDSVDGAEVLREALDLARSIDFVEEELPALRALAISSLRQHRVDESRDLVNATFVKAERGPFALYAADSYCILSQVEHAAGDRDASIRAARCAYELSWCDGPPYAYEKGLHDSAAVLRTLDEAPPRLPPFKGEVALTVAEINALASTDK